MTKKVQREWSRHDLLAVQRLAEIARQPADRARVCGIPFGRDSEQVVHHLAGLCDRLATELLRMLPPEPEAPSRRRQPQQAGSAPRRRATGERRTLTQRLVLLLTVDSRTVDELSEILGLSHGAVYQLARRARREGHHIQQDGAGCYVLLARGDRS